METHDASPTAIGDSNAAMKLAPTVAETHHTSSSALHERDMRILRKLAQHHPMAILPVDIGAGSRNTVANRLKDLHKRGLVEQTNGPRGGWGLTSKGLDMTVSKPSTK
jgi:RIO-like serine/threonine protein kinase